MPERIGSVVLEERPLEAIESESSSSVLAIETFIPIPFLDIQLIIVVVGHVDIVDISEKRTSFPACLLCVVL